MVRLEVPCAHFLCTFDHAPHPQPNSVLALSEGRRARAVAANKHRGPHSCGPAGPDAKGASGLCLCLERCCARAGLRHTTQAARPGSVRWAISIKPRWSKQGKLPRSAVLPPVWRYRGAQRRRSRLMPAGRSSASMRACVIMPRSPTHTTCVSPKRALTCRVAPPRCSDRPCCLQTPPPPPAALGAAQQAEDDLGVLALVIARFAKAAKDSSVLWTQPS